MKSFKIVYNGDGVVALTPFILFWLSSGRYSLKTSVGVIEESFRVATEPRLEYVTWLGVFADFLLSTAKHEQLQH